MHKAHVMRCHGKTESEHDEGTTSGTCLQLLLNRLPYQELAETKNVFFDWTDEEIQTEDLKKGVDKPIQVFLSEADTGVSCCHANVFLPHKRVCRTYCLILQHALLHTCSVWPSQWNGLYPCRAV
jgi:hypothetical protein